jgi:hypothetical protein
MSEPKTKGYPRVKESKDQSEREKGTETPPRVPDGDPGRQGQERQAHDLRPQSNPPHTPEGD